jgi:hypothetical protein
MRTTTWAIGLAGGLAFLIGAIGSSTAEEAKSPYPSMAPIAQYKVAGDEAALARSAAPPSISDDAGVMVLGSRGYETVAKSKNGFVCIVERSWGAGFDDPGFWNPKIRGPICFNAAAARSVVPAYLERTQWILAGVSKADMAARIKSELAANTFVMPEPGAMCYMLSKQQYLSDDGGHWHPHLMFFVAHADLASWGGGLKGSPVLGAVGNPDPVTTFFVPVAKWSDGTPAAMAMH